ncbi:MAG: hypothetical protein QOJ06_3429 [Pseudonocardiales bacterium]|jgi:hypothetical protein|nr:hypothetical protein [Pseudonocardiales bacterium]
MSISPGSRWDTATSTTTPTIYQLRAWVHGVSPLIWRRLLVPAESSIAELHTILQTAFGWTDEYLHRFVIHGVEYGANPFAGPFRDDARQIRLDGLGLRITERFTYHYNFTADWQLNLRLEQTLLAAAGRIYPRCTGGRRAGPPQDWAGPWDYLERTQPYLVFDAMLRAADIISQLLDADEEQDWASVGVHRGELAGLAPLLGLEHFDRQTLNQALSQRGTASRGVA